MELREAPLENRDFSIVFISMRHNPKQEAKLRINVQQNQFRKLLKQELVNFKLFANIHCSQGKKGKNEAVTLR